VLEMAYKGSINVSPISRSAMRSGVLLSAAAKRSIGSHKQQQFKKSASTKTEKQKP